MLRAPLLRGRVLVAVSGGPDSTALLVALHEARNEVVAAHYDHALRDGSDRVAGQVAELCGRLGVGLIAERRAGALARGSLQAAARALRYEFLDRARMEAGADVVALAHTADDLVEGAVLHLLRGCGLAGFRGMPDRRAHYVRPWLAAWRSEIEGFLRERGIEAYEDPANRDPRFARVRVRRDLLPALERDRPGLVRRLHSAAVAVSALHESVARQAEAALERGTPPAAELALMPEPVATEILGRLYRRAGGPEPGLGRAHVRAMLRLAGGGRGGRGVDLPANLRFRIVGAHMEVIARERPAPPPARLVVTACAGCGDPDVAHLRPGLELRVGFRTPGLRIRPLDGRGTRKLQDVFVDARVPREERDGWPLVFAGDRLAWAPGLAVDAAHAALPGRAAMHVTLEPMPVRFPAKVVRLETPRSPSRRA